MSRLYLLVGIFISLVAFSQTQILHTHCYMNYVFKENCDDIFHYLTNQVKYFNVTEVRENNYTLISADAENLILKAIHTTTLKLYIDDLKFVFGQSLTCNIRGESESRTISIYDYCTNYCNLFNLFRKYPHHYTEIVDGCKYIPAKS